MEFDLREFSKDKNEEIISCLIGTIYGHTNIIPVYSNDKTQVQLIKYYFPKKKHRRECIGTNYEPSRYGFDEYFKRDFYDLYFDYTRHEPEYYLNTETEELTDEEQEIKKMLEMLDTFHSAENPMDVKFIMKYPLVLVNTTGPCYDDERGADNGDCILPTKRECKVNDTNEFTFRDLCEAAYIVKTKKFDTWYELYENCYKLLEHEKHELLSIAVAFGHGS